FPFLYLTLPPPFSILFPYTTLFRSVYAVDRGLVVLAQALPVAAPDPLQLRRLGRHRRRHHRRQVTNHQHVGPAGTWIAAGSVPVDRKSTRLNSSHVAISYAVFCLKK